MFPFVTKLLIISNIRLNIPRNVPSDFMEDGPESLPHEGNDHQSLSTPTTPVRELPGARGKPNNANLQQEMISSSTSPDKSIGTSMAPQTNTETQATVDTVHAETGEFIFISRKQMPCPQVELVSALSLCMTFNHVAVFLWLFY